MQADISIIIPVYNMEKHLRDCINSVINQTYRNIEIICIDDASEDESQIIIKEYADIDERLKMVSEPRNVGTSKARKDGVLKSTGQYILFIDADDCLEKNACEKLAEVMKENSADIVQFGVYVKACAGIKISDAKIMQNWMKPYLGKHDIDDIQNLCFKEKKIGHNLSGKLLNGDICRRAFSYLSDEKFVMAEDMYAFLAITEISQSYLGIPDMLYIYNYGYGITGKKKDLLAQFETYCELPKIIEGCRSILEKSGKNIELYEYIQDNLLDICIGFMIGNAEKLKQYSEQILINMLIKYWNKKCIGKMVLTLLSESNFGRRVTEDKKWLFPFKHIKRDSRVVLYGAGDMGHDYYRQIKETNYCELSAWVDRAFMDYYDNDYKISSPEEINRIDFDYVVIAVYGEKIRKDIKRFLITLGVRRECII
ncbi:glycosyltransferase family 2 protein [bacterium 1XD42-94]|nr:glycosyltransferase family 2 protein [bacterium 1XD42-76]NBK04352.1 glycosyltransferase family 2 protein [bacterium 1XD42-94]